MQRHDRSQRPNDMEDPIIDLVGEVSGRLYLSREMSASKWTSELKDALALLGKKDQGCYVCPGSGRGEWMWDLCWLKEADPDAEGFDGVALACEIEWYSRRVEDFRKLTVCNADVRLCIFDGGTNQAQMDHRFVELEKAAEWTKGQEKRFLAIALPSVRAVNRGTSRPTYRIWKP